MRFATSANASTFDILSAIILSLVYQLEIPLNSRLTSATSKRIFCSSKTPKGSVAQSILLGSQTITLVGLGYPGHRLASQRGHDALNLIPRLERRRLRPNRRQGKYYFSCRHHLMW